MQVDFGGPESEHNIHLAPHAHFDHAASHGNPAFSPFRHPAVPPIDPSLEHSAGANRNGHAPMSAVHQSAQNHLLQPDNALAHGFYGDMPRSSQTPSTPSNASPRFAAISPSSQPKQVASTYVPTDRSAPSRDVSDDTIDDAYAAFILYCNPNFPTSTDTSELTQLFRTPPKSDGNAFSTWTLFELIRKLEAKEIKTWTQLALDLGVQPPDTDKGQSTQKVQQYSVRLKRWMHAMHIDAFFEYLLGKNPAYFAQIPPPHNPFPENGRDGVPLEEDLAIRALDPKFRPKRGRRKADDGEDDMEMMDNTPPRKRPQLDTSIPFGNVLQPQSAYPNSAHPDNIEGFLGSHDPWATSAITPATALTTSSAPGRMNLHKNLTPYSASPMSGQQIRWRLNTQDNPTTPHPLSAVTPQSAHPDFFDEPQSAVTPSSAKTRPRRRHGPAVSSAWPSNNTSSTGKLRGRPPSNRSVRDGPFVTFPANPRMKEGPTIDMHRNPGNLTPIVERAQSDPPVPEQHFRFPPTPASAVSPTNIDSQLQNAPQRPHRLSLQVPQNVGNPVRLATPTVLVTGEQDATPSTGRAPSAISNDSVRTSAGYFQSTEMPLQQQTASAQGQTASQSQASPRSQPQAAAVSTPSLPALPSEALNRALVAELIRAPLSGRRKRLRGPEAKNLAAAILQPLYVKPAVGSASPANVMSEQMLNIAIGSCLGIASAVGLGKGGPNGGVRRVECARFRIGEDGYESPIDDDDEDANGLREGGAVRETFDVYFSVSFGGLNGEWTAKGLLATTAAEENQYGSSTGPGGKQDQERLEAIPNTVAAWKTKFLDAQRKLWESQEEARTLKEKILEAVL